MSMQLIWSMLNALFQQSVSVVHAEIAVALLIRLHRLTGHSHHLEKSYPRCLILPKLHLPRSLLPSSSVSFRCLNYCCWYYHYYQQSCFDCSSFVTVTVFLELSFYPQFFSDIKKSDIRNTEISQNLRILIVGRNL